MAKHDVDPVLRQLVRAINESGQAAAAGARGGEIAEGLWRVSLEAVDAWTLRAGAVGEAGNRGPFDRLLGNT